jgi:hypothetical protein
VYQTVI